MALDGIYLVNFSASFFLFFGMSRANFAQTSIGQLLSVHFATKGLLGDDRFHKPKDVRQQLGGYAHLGILHLGHPVKVKISILISYIEISMFCILTHFWLVLVSKLFQLNAIKLYEIIRIFFEFSKNNNKLRKFSKKDSARLVTKKTSLKKLKVSNWLYLIDVICWN
jgi:hypothetical protein